MAVFPPFTIAKEGRVTKVKAEKVTKPKQPKLMIPKLFSDGNLASYIFQTYIETENEPQFNSNDPTEYRKKITEIDIGIEQLICQRKLYLKKMREHEEQIIDEREIEET